MMANLNRFYDRIAKVVDSSELTAEDCISAGLSIGSALIAQARDLGGEEFLRDQAERPAVAAGAPNAELVYSAVGALLALADAADAEDAAAGRGGSS